MKKIVKDSFWNSFDFLISFLIAFINIKVLTGKFGIDGYGFYSLFVGLIGTFGLVDIGLGMAISKYLCEYIPQKKYKEANEVVLVGIYFYFIIGIFLFLIIFFLKEHIISFLKFPIEYYEISKKIIIITPIIMVINFFSEIFMNIIVAYQNWKLISIINSVIKIINFMLLLILVFVYEKHKAIEYVFYMMLILSIIKLCFFIYKSMKLYNNELKIIKISKGTLSKVFSFLQQSFFQYLFSILLGQLDKIIIARYINISAVGIYDISLKVSIYVYSFVTNILKIVFPMFSKLHGEKNGKKLEKIFNKGMIITISLNSFFVLIILLFWKTLMSLYLGKELALKAYEYVVYLGVFTIIRSPEIIYYYFFNAIALPKVFVINNFFNAIINVSFYFLLLPNYGVKGLIFSQIIGKIIVNIGTYLFYKKNILRKSL